MKTSILPVTAVIISFCLFLCESSAYAQGQGKLSQADSDRYEQARNNKDELRKLVREKNGTRLGASAQNRLGYMAYDQGNLQEAKAEYLETYRGYQNIPEMASARLHLGKIHYKERDYENARTYFGELANSRQPDRAEWGRYYLARTLRALNDPGTEAAIEQYFSNPRRETNEKDVIVQNELERYYNQTRQFEKAIQAAEELVERYPDSKYAPMNEAKIVDLYIALGNTEKAIEYSKTIIQKYDERGYNAARAQNSLAGTLAGRGDFEQARLEYAQVASGYLLHQRWVNAAAYGMAMTDLREGMMNADTTLVSRALDGFWALQQAHPEDRHVPRAMMNAAQISIQRDMLEEALKAYEIILSFDPDIIDVVKPGGHSNDLEGHRQLVRQARLSKARLLRNRMDRPEAALSEYDTMLAQKPGDSEALLGKAMCLQELDRVEESRDILTSLSGKESQYREVALSLLESLKPESERENK